MTVTPIPLDGFTCIGVEVKLPKTTLLVISTDSGYVMCGALDVGLLRDKLANRGIIAARAVGVKTLNELLNGTVESCTQHAQAIGIQPGMSIKDALLAMKQAELAPHPNIVS